MKKNELTTKNTKGTKNKAYPNYKPSGVEWLGDVPEHWGVKKLKWAYQGIGSGDGISPDDIEPNGTYPIYGGNGIMGYTESYNSNNMDIIIGRVGAKCGNVYTVDGPKWISDNALKLKINRVILKYLALVLEKRNLNELANQNAQPLITGSMVGNQFIPLPEQQAIATFLDRETGRIDALIAKKQRLLELLAEQRTALISATVTGKIDITTEDTEKEKKQFREFRAFRSYPKYKPSGVEWLGDMPEHWGVKALKYLFENLDYRRIPLAGEDRAGIEKIFPYYGASGIIDYVDDYIYDETLILVAEDGANLLSRSTPLAFRGEGKYWVNNHAHILRPKYDAITYWESILQVFDYTPYVTGSAQPKLTSDNLGSFILPVPPLPEQQAIADFLDRETAKIDALSAKVVTVIERLKEYRTALISSAVTGKINVSTCAESAQVQGACYDK